MAHGVPDPPEGRGHERAGGWGWESAGTPAEAPTASVFPLPGPPDAASAPGYAGVAAGWWRRAGSAVIDFFVRMVLLLVPLGLGALGFLVNETAGFVGLAIGYLPAVALASAYAPVMLARGGQTLGDRAVDIRVVSSNGARLTGGTAFVREFLVKGMVFDGLAIFTLGILPLVNYLWPLWDDRGQALHDKMVDTLSVRA